MWTPPAPCPPVRKSTQGPHGVCTPLGRRNRRCKFSSSKSPGPPEPSLQAPTFRHLLQDVKHLAFLNKALGLEEVHAGQDAPVRRASRISASLRALSLWLRLPAPAPTAPYPHHLLSRQQLVSRFISGRDVAGQKEDTTTASSREGQGQPPDIDARMPGRGDHSAVDLRWGGVKSRSKC